MPAIGIHEGVKTGNFSIEFVFNTSELLVEELLGSLYRVVLFNFIEVHVHVVNYLVERFALTGGS